MVLSQSLWTPYCTLVDADKVAVCQMKKHPSKSEIKIPKRQICGIILQIKCENSALHWHKCLSCGMPLACNCKPGHCSLSRAFSQSNFSRRSKDILSPDKVLAQFGKAGPLQLPPGASMQSCSAVARLLARATCFYCTPRVFHPSLIDQIFISLAVFYCIKAQVGDTKLFIRAQQQLSSNIQSALFPVLTFQNCR